MSRKTFMSDADIRQLEAMSDAEIGMLVHKMGVAKTGEFISSIMRSYRISSMVANAAWTVIDELDAGNPLSLRELRAALNLYSPGNFPPYASDLEHTCRTLEELYDHLSQYSGEGNSTMVMLEQLYERIVAYRALLPEALA
jgi:hypothetical protein